MTERLEHRLQRLLGDRTRLNEIDPRFLTRDLGHPRWLVAFPMRLVRTAVYELLYEAWRHTRGRDARAVRPIFIVGVPHSGTSVFMRLVAEHPDVANLSEANTILQPHGYFDAENGERARTRLDATPAECARLHARLEFHRWLAGKRRVLNKSPNNTVRLDFLHAVFPDACFVHIVRDGRAVAYSLVWGHADPADTADRSKPWRQRRNPFPGVRPPGWRALLRDDAIEQHALQWREALGYALDVAERERLRVLQVRYEELCDDTRAVLGAVFRFCDLDASAALLERFPKNLDNRNFKWRSGLSPAAARLVTDIQAPMLRRLGYEL
jgi:hypothetical protein